MTYVDKPACIHDLKDIVVQEEALDCGQCRSSSVPVQSFVQIVSGCDDHSRFSWISLFYSSRKSFLIFCGMGEMQCEKKQKSSFQACVHVCMYFPIATMKFHALAQHGVSTPFSLSVMLVGYQLICVSNLTHS